MKKYLVTYAYVDAEGTNHVNQYTHVFAQNQNEAFVIAAGKLFAFFNNSTDTIKSVNLTEITEDNGG